MPVRLEAAKRFENRLAELGRHAGAPVAHAHLQPFHVAALGVGRRGHLGVDFHGRIGSRVFDGIAHDVFEGAVQRLPGDLRHEAAGRIQGHGASARLGLEGGILGNVGQQLHDIDTLAHRTDGAGLQLVQRQQFLDQAVEPLGLPGNALGHDRPRLRALLHEPDRRLDTGQR